MAMSGDPGGRRLRVAETLIEDAGDCFVVAEIGHNHQGSLERAVELLRAAADCGADAVKLQKRDNRTLYTADYFSRPYDHENSFGATYGEHREFLEFGRDEYLELKRVAAELGLVFLATPFDMPSVDFLADLDLPAYKVASADLLNTPLLKHVAQIGKPVIVSTGAARFDDVRLAYETVASINSQVALLQCTASYPPAWEEIDLRVVETYRREFPEAVIGLSSHDSGIAMALAAYVLGARIVEKHFTLNRAMKGTDHRFSLEPQGLQKLVRDLRRARIALGDGKKRMYPSEAEPSVKMGKKLVAASALEPGHVLRPEDIAAKSPGDGLPPYEVDRFVGRRLRYPVPADSALTFDLLEDFEREATLPPGRTAASRVGIAAGSNGR